MQTAGKQERRTQKATNVTSQSIKMMTDIKNNNNDHCSGNAREMSLLQMSTKRHENRQAPPP